MHIFLATLGSLGDVYPLLSIARALRDLGAKVTLGVQGEYLDQFAHENFDMIKIFPNQDKILADMGLSESEHLKRLFSSQDFLFKECLPLGLEQGTRAILEKADQFDLIGCTFQTEPAKIAAEARGIPLVPLFLQPCMLFDPYEPPNLKPRLIRLRNPGSISAWINKNLMQIGGILYNWQIGRTIHKFRHQLGLRETYVTYLQFPPIVSHALALYPEFLHQHIPQNPYSLDFTGFCQFDEPYTPDPELQRFLKEGDPPIVFSFGSHGKIMGEEFYPEAMDAIGALGERAIFLVGEDSKMTTNDENILLRGYIPHQSIFEAASVVVHHGGIGTLGRAVTAAAPQLVVPFGVDQFDNAERIERLKLGLSISSRRFKRRQIARKLEELLNDPKFRTHALARAQEQKSTDGARNAAALLVRLAENQSK